MRCSEFPNYCQMGNWQFSEISIMHSSTSTNSSSLWLYNNLGPDSGVPGVICRPINCQSQADKLSALLSEITTQMITALSVNTYA